MKLPDKVYDFLKYLCIIAFPALEEFIPKFFEIWKLPYGSEISRSLNAIAVLIGALICVSVINYNRNKTEQIVDKNTESKG